jgi:hypothetical protein
MLKLYRTSGGVTEYWEAWITATDVTIHWGKVGEEGETRELPHEAGLHPSEIIKREAKTYTLSSSSTRSEVMALSTIMTDVFRLRSE